MGRAIRRRPWMGRHGIAAEAVVPPKCPRVTLFRMASLKLGVYVPPMLATATDQIPTADGWACEVKWDGVRAQLHVVDGQPRLFTRRGREVTSLVPELRGMEALSGDACILDGELVAQEADGTTSFHRVMTRLVS